MRKYLLLLGLAALLAASATIHLCSERLVELGLAPRVDGRPLQCTEIVAFINAVFVILAARVKRRTLVACYAFMLAMIFASGFVAVLATCSIAINPVRGMSLIVVAAASQAAVAVLLATRQPPDEVDIDL